MTVVGVKLHNPSQPPQGALYTPEYEVNPETYNTVGFLRCVRQAVRKHGPIVRMLLPNGEQKLILGTPEAADFWRRNSRQLIKDVDDYPAPAALTRLILDNNLTSAREGAEWEEMRARVSPLMRYKLRPYALAVETATQQLIDALRTPETSAGLWSLCGQWSAHTVCAPVLGVAFAQETVLDMVNGLRFCMFHLVKESASHSKTQLKQDDVLVRLRKHLDQIVILAIMASRPEDETMVSVLLAQQGWTGGTPDDALVRKLRPILMGALAAAVHNNSLAMYWTLTKLAQSPDVCDAIAQETCTNGQGPWTISKAPVALASLREALRIFPVLPFIERKAANPLAIEGHQIQAGETVVFSPWVVHRNPKVWPDPLRYDISRFLGGARTDLTHWFPFGLGHRACIGANLAQSQLAKACGLVCQKLHLSIPDNTRPTFWQPTYRVLLEPREDGGRLSTRSRP